MPRPLGQPRESHGKDWVALTLALGISCAINILTFAVLYDAIFSEGPGLSENATQVLVAAFGGIMGVLGSYIGFKAGTMNRDEPPLDQPGSAGLPSEQTTEAPSPDRQEHP